MALARSFSLLGRTSVRRMAAAPFSSAAHLPLSTLSEEERMLKETGECELLLPAGAPVV